MTIYRNNQKSIYFSNNEEKETRYRKEVAKEGKNELIQGHKLQSELENEQADELTVNQLAKLFKNTLKKINTPRDLPVMPYPIPPTPETVATAAVQPPRLLRPPRTKIKYIEKLPYVFNEKGKPNSPVRPARPKSKSETKQDVKMEDVESKSDIPMGVVFNLPRGWNFWSPGKMVTNIPQYAPGIEESAEWGLIVNIKNPGEKKREIVKYVQNFINAQRENIPEVSVQEPHNINKETDIRTISPNTIISEIPKLYPGIEKKLEWKNAIDKKNKRKKRSALLKVITEYRN